MNRWYRQSLPGRGLFVVFLTLVLLGSLWHRCLVGVGKSVGPR